ncbi:MAG: transglutaminase family protein [Fluviicola sp.]|nr:transglutaminase family protein [Fluviicola sp.]
MEADSNENYLSATPTLDYQSDEVQAFMADLPLTASIEEKAFWIYHKVRNHFLYDPYHLDLRPSQLKASVVATKSRAWCVEKAVLTAACMRAVGVPTRLGFGIVKNHIGVEKLTSYLKRDEIVFHGFVDVFLNGKWTKCTPAFDQRICAMSGVEPLDWNATEDSLFQAFSSNGRFMEYLHFYGVFPDVPFELMHQEMFSYYPHLFHEQIETRPFSFHFDAGITEHLKKN